MTERQKFLLVFLSAGDEFLAPLRIMGGLFVISQKRKGSLPKSALYDFRFYPMGLLPHAPDFYFDLGHLVNERLVEWRPLPYASWAIYRATPTGKKLARAIAKRYPKEIVSYIQQIRSWVGKAAIKDLVRAVKVINAATQV